MKGGTNFILENFKKIIFKIFAGVPVITLYFRVIFPFFRWESEKNNTKVFPVYPGVCGIHFRRGTLNVILCLRFLSQIVVWSPSTAY